MGRRKKRIHHTWEECVVIPKGEFIEALEDWCEERGNRPVTARGLDSMLGIERVKQ